MASAPRDASGRDRRSRASRRRRCSAGITVLTDLNPWLVARTSCCRWRIIAITFLLWWRLRGAAAGRGPPLPRSGLPAATVVVTVAVLGDRHGRHRQRPARRRPTTTARLHRTGLQRVGDGAAARRRRDGADRAHRRAGRAAGSRCSSAAAATRPPCCCSASNSRRASIGYTQYFLHVPAAAGRPAHVRRLPGLDRARSPSLVRVDSRWTASTSSEHLADACRSATPTRAPTTVPLTRMNCRSRPTCSSRRRLVSSASQRSTVVEMMPAMSSA